MRYIVLLLLLCSCASHDHIKYPTFYYDEEVSFSSGQCIGYINDDYGDDFSFVILHAVNCSISPGGSLINRIQIDKVNLTRIN